MDGIFEVKKITETPFKRNDDEIWQIYVNNSIDS